MILNKIKIGKYIKIYNKKCNINNLSNNDISGINKEKEFFEPSPQVGEDTSKYKIVPPGYFACNLMHVGRDALLPIAFNHTNKNKIVSPAYQVFSFVENNEILPEYFFLFLKSSEKDRFFWFNADSSIRDGMSWEDFINVDIELPSLSIQKKYVTIYDSIQKNQKTYEDRLNYLKQVCDYYIEDLRKIDKVNIGDHIIEYNEKNEKLIATKEMGVSINKEFFPTKANASDVKKQKVVYPRTFAYNTNTSRNSDTISIALNDSNEVYAVSNTYCVFKTDDKLIPEYLLLWLKRKEFDRYARFNSWGSARETIEFNEIKKSEIAIPDIQKQQSIVNIHLSYMKYFYLNEKLKALIKTICPILVKGALDEAKKEA